jgi:cytochrome b6-f complex iron-sulfur subunit
VAQEQDKTAERPIQETINRRQFFVKLGTGSIAVAGLGACVFGYEFLSPNILYEPSPIVNAGKPEQYPADSVTLDPATAIYVIHSAQGFYALNAICTHLGCLTAWKPEADMIACPCHGSKFRRDGTKIAGPAPRPLQRLKLWLNEDGELMVDRSTEVSNREVLAV